MNSLPEIARTIFLDSIADCSIERAFDRILEIRGEGNGAQLFLAGEDILALGPIRHLRIVAAGKAAAPMLNALLPRLPLPPACDLQGVLIAPTHPPNLPQTVQFFPGGHPVPNAASFAGASAALSMLRAIPPTPPHLSEHDNAPATLCLFLISGGASSMMELPLDPAISLADTVAFHQALVHSGASIVEINCIRKHFSAVKGGRLALAAGSAAKLTLLVSDVPPAHLDALASGPTLPDPTTIAQCHDILAKYALLARFPATVRCFFESPNLPETPKPAQLTSRAWKLLDSDDLAESARRRASALGFHTVIDNTCDDWTYDAAATYLVKRLRTLRQQHSRVCLISTGEVTVELPALPTSSAHSPSTQTPTTHPAIGGRNQHLALYLATLLQPSDGPIAVLSAGSDGIDGNSPAAGAVIDHHTLAEENIEQNPARPPASAASASIQPRRATALEALAVFDSSSWLERAGATIVTGPTGHNLRDLRILLAAPPAS